MQHFVWEEAGSCWTPWLRSCLFGCHKWVVPISAALRQGPHFKLQRWRVVGKVWEIWSARDLNSISPASAC